MRTEVLSTVGSSTKNRPTCSLGHAVFRFEFFWSLGSWNPGDTPHLHRLTYIYTIFGLEGPVFFLEVGPFPSYYACGGDQRQAPSAGRLLQFLSIVGRQGLLTVWHALTYALLTGFAELLQLCKLLFKLHPAIESQIEATIPRSPGLNDYITNPPKAPNWTAEGIWLIFHEYRTTWLSLVGSHSLQ